MNDKGTCITGCMHVSHGRLQAKDILRDRDRERKRGGGRGGWEASSLNDVIVVLGRIQIQNASYDSSDKSHFESTVTYSHRKQTLNSIHSEKRRTLFRCQRRLIQQTTIGTWSDAQSAGGGLPTKKFVVFLKFWARLKFNRSFTPYNCAVRCFHIHMKWWLSIMVSRPLSDSIAKISSSYRTNYSPETLNLLR